MGSRLHGVKRGQGAAKRGQGTSKDEAAGQSPPLPSCSRDMIPFLPSKPPVGRHVLDY